MKYLSYLQLNSLLSKLDKLSLFWIFVSTSLFIPREIIAQGCDKIVFSVSNTSPCCYNLTAQNMTDNCFQQLNLKVADGVFTSFTPRSGWQINPAGANEYNIRPSIGFIPFGNVNIASFCVSGIPSQDLVIHWDNLCLLEACEAILPIKACLPGNVIRGVKYVDVGCEGKPYSNQPILADWPVDLYDEFGVLIANTQTDNEGKFSFTGLLPRKYICREGMQIGWQPSLPKSGEYKISLIGNADTSIVNFGNCPTTCSCDSINFNLVQLDSNNDSCCYELSLINFEPYCFKNITINIDSSEISSINILIDGWQVNKISSSIIVLTPPFGDPLPIGNLKPIQLCASQKATHNITISTAYFNGSIESKCKKMFNFECRPNFDTCCAFAIHLVNKYTDNRVKYIKVSGLCDTKICCADPDEWLQNSYYPNYIIWKPANNLPVPYGTAIDNDFLIWINGTVNSSVQLEWYDQSDNLLHINILNLNCKGIFQDDEDWTKYTSSYEKPQDNNLLSFAVREPEEDSESECQDEEILRIDCNISESIICSSNNYLVSLTGPVGYNTYTWTIQSGPNTPSIQNNNTNIASFIGIPGSYIISLIADNGQNNSCYGEIEITIPDIIADFTWEFALCPSNTKVQIIAAGCEEGGCTYQWSCSSFNDFPTTGSTINYTFPQTNNDYLITLVITDAYGCTHAITKEIKVNLMCNAALEVEKFILCDEDCNGKSSTSVTVTFKNNSTGGICPINYDWDFGDPNNPGTLSGLNTPKVTYTYNTVPCPNGKSYNVKLTMKEGPNNMATCSTTISADISPCEVDFTYTTCPDGKLIVEGNVPGEWDFPGSQSICPWPVSDKKENGLRRRVVVRYDNSGIYNVKFTGHCENKGTCTIQKRIEILIECCAKNDLVKDKHYFNEGGKNYKFKSRFVQRQLPLFHRIKATSKLKVKKSSSGINYWNNSKAYEIEAGFKGKIYSRENDCNCKTETTLTYDNDLNSNKSKAKKVLKKLGKFRSKKNTIESMHRVKISSTSNDIIIPLWLGKDCDPFRCWLDWF